MSVTPYLYYEDVAGTMKFLTTAFGLKRFGRPMHRNGKINHAVMKLGDDVVMMGCPPSGYRNPRHLGQATQSLYVTVDDIDEHFIRARKAGAKILEEPAETPYGQRRYGAEDPEGHQWYFAQEVKRMGSKSKRTNKKP